MNLDEDFDEEIIEPMSEGEGVTIDDFRACMQTSRYIFMPCCTLWPATSVDARLPRVTVLTKTGRPKLDKDGNVITISASKWLAKNRPVEQMTWCPGLPPLIPDRLVIDGGWINRKGVTCFNLYRPPHIKPGDSTKAGPWADHIHEIYPNDAEHIIAWLAQRVQAPEEKINHALVLGGGQGIGKDTLLEPVKRAVGPWNFKDIIPSQLLGRFNDFAKAVILRINEAHDQGDAERVNRFNLYERVKLYSANPPDVLRVDEKHLREYYVFNCLGLIITTNHRADGIYLPSDDRRHYVAWSERTKEEFSDDYWETLWTWYRSGGFEHVAAYLDELDLRGFDPKAPPPKTETWRAIVIANAAPEDAELADVLDGLGNPDAVTLVEIRAAATGDIADWLFDRRNRRTIPHRLEACGYVAADNPKSDEGLWRIQGSRQRVYVKARLSAQEKIQAARRKAT